MKNVLLVAAWCAAFQMSAQSYDSFLVGSAEDVEATTQKLMLLAGGAGDNDPAMTAFLEAAGGGDVVVIRASGSDGYNDYLFSDLGVAVNSVETIVFNSAAAAEDAYVLEQLQNAEAIFIAGGDQEYYVDYWKDTQVETLLIAQALEGPIGGTSAGMAILGTSYFAAQNGTVYSDEALEDPFNQYMTLGHNDFVAPVWGWSLITDTHFDEPDRSGRMLAFFAHMLDNNSPGRSLGIGCDEYTAVIIRALEANGTHDLTVYGEYPAYDDFAYFLLPDCFYFLGDPEGDDTLPEVFEAGQPLTWNPGGQGAKVLRVAGTESGTVVDFESAENGGNFAWQNWSASEGALSIEEAEPYECLIVSTLVWCNEGNHGIRPNPASDFVYVEPARGEQWTVTTLQGKRFASGVSEGLQLQLDVSDWPEGVYLFRSETFLQRLVVTH